MTTSTGVLFGRRARVSFTLPSGQFAQGGNTITITGGDDPKEPGLRITFKITKTSQKEPNAGEITIYNLSPDSRGALGTKGVKVLLEAGYVATGLAQCFIGDARTIDHIREGADWKTIVRLGDGERAFQFARASESFAGGCTVGDVVRYCAGAMGLAMGNVGTEAAKLATKLQHGWVSHGAASSELDRIVRSVGYSYSIQDGQVFVMAPGQALTQAIPDLDSTSGLIGSLQMGTPEKKGKAAALKFRALLMPQAMPGGRIHVKSERYNGVFRTRKVEHSGDTRGGEWYSDFESVADPSATVTT